MFGRTLREVTAAGVEAVAYAMDITTEGIKPGPALPLILPKHRPFPLNQRTPRLFNSQQVSSSPIKGTMATRLLCDR